MNWVDFLDKALPVILSAGGVYAAIRADLARLHERASNAKEAADKAHDRIDELLKAKK